MPRRRARHSCRAPKCLVLLERGTRPQAVRAAPYASAVLVAECSTSRKCASGRSPAMFHRSMRVRAPVYNMLRRSPYLHRNSTLSVQQLDALNAIPAPLPCCWFRGLWARRICPQLLDVAVHDYIKCTACLRDTREVIQQQKWNQSPRSLNANRKPGRGESRYRRRLPEKEGRSASRLAPRTAQPCL